MKQTLLFFFVLFISLNTPGQNFPPPTYFVVSLSLEDSVHLFWCPPETKNLSHYNLYEKGLSYSIPSLIDSTIDTFYVCYLSYWAYLRHYEVTACYINPTGESEPVSCTVWIPLIWELPVQEGFENDHAVLGSAILKGENEWDRTDSISFEGIYSAFYKSNNLLDSSILFSTVISIYNTFDPVLSFYYKIPNNMGFTDTLKVFYNESLSLNDWIPLSIPYYSSNDWKKTTLSLKNLPDCFHIGFFGISNNGDGIFIDDLNLFDNAMGNSDKYYDDLSIVFKVFPNPSKENLNFKISGVNNCRAKLSIFDISGQLHEIVFDKQPRALGSAHSPGALLILAFPS